MAKLKQRTYTQPGIRQKIDGHTFDSKLEARRYRELKWQEREGYVTNLRLQPRFAIKNPANGNTLTTYVGDFRYTRNGVDVIEDVKRIRTKEYIIKKKLMKEFRGIHITESHSNQIDNGMFEWVVDGVVESFNP